MILHFWQFFLYLADDNDVMSDQYFVPQNKLYQRSPFIPYFDYYPSYIIWVKNYTQLFSIFDSTILQCKQKVDVGIYDPGKYVHTLSSLLRVLFYYLNNLIWIFQKRLRKNRSYCFISGLPQPIFGLYYMDICRKSLLNNQYYLFFKF